MKNTRVYLSTEEFEMLASMALTASDPDEKRRVAEQLAEYAEAKGLPELASGYHYHVSSNLELIRPY